MGEGTEIQRHPNRQLTFFVSIVKWYSGSVEFSG